MSNYYTKLAYCFFIKKTIVEKHAVLLQNRPGRMIYGTTTNTLSLSSLHERRTVHSLAATITNYVPELSSRQLSCKVQKTNRISQKRNRWQNCYYLRPHEQYFYTWYS